MQNMNGTHQSRLRRIIARWGKLQRRHKVLIPFFHDDYRVFGFMGVTPRVEPVWYPGLPVAVTPGEVSFKSLERDVPPGLAECDPDTFEGAYFYDGSQELAQLVMLNQRYPSFERTVNLANYRLKGRRVTDLAFERTLHRVRGFIIRSGWFSTTHVSIMRISSLETELTEMRRKTSPRTAGAPARTLREQLEAQSQDSEV